MATWDIEYWQKDDHGLNIQFGIESDEGDRYSLTTRNINVFDALEIDHCDIEDLFEEIQGRMLSMAISLLNDGYLEEDEIFTIKKYLFDEYF